MIATKIAYSLTEAAEATSLSKTHLRQAIEAGDLPAKRSSDSPQARVLIGADALAAYIDGLLDA